jgi:hypothetical protein
LCSIRFGTDEQQPWASGGFILGWGAGMETGRSEMDADAGRRESDGKIAEYLELELAVGYVANSVLNLEIAEEFSAINEEQF